MSATPKKFMTCGMYAFSNELQQAWQAIFTGFHGLLADARGLEKKLLFEADEARLRDPDLFIGHTCGYPLMARLQDALMPFCVPVFNLPGSSGTQYSSHIIVAADCAIKSLADCRGGVAAFNEKHSNSGMNLLRHAVAQLDPGERFFESVIESGGHLPSLRAVAEGRADVAAIDCVSFQLFQDHFPELTARVRSIAYSVSTAGLPLVVPRSGFSQSDTGSYIVKLNRALEQIPSTLRQRLHLSHFEEIRLQDYQSVMDLESYAIEKGYAQLK